MKSNSSPERQETVFDESDHNSAEDPGDHKVGHGKPPLQRRFKKSGNPCGRPAGAQNRKTIVRKIAQQTHQVTEGGKTVQRTTLELVLIQLRNRALEGKNAQAVAEFHRLLEKCEPSSLAQNAGVLVAPAQISVEEWIARAERHNALMVKHGFRNLGAVYEFERAQRKKGLK